MVKIEVSEAARDRLLFAAKIANVSLSEAIDRLVGITDSPANTPTVPPDTATTSDEITVSVVYRGERIAGLLNLETERLRITDAPKDELLKTFNSPSQAAVEIVRCLNPQRKRPETNGWRFFYAGDGQLADRHRRHRA